MKKKITVSIYLFKIIQMIIGAPNMAVTELIGNVMLPPGSCEMTSHRSITIAPHSMLTGSTLR